MALEKLAIVPPRNAAVARTPPPPGFKGHTGAVEYSMDISHGNNISFTLEGNILYLRGVLLP